MHSARAACKSAARAPGSVFCGSLAGERWKLRVLFEMGWYM
jgi:hypothetical protein